jgi:hypothetical protein
MPILPLSRRAAIALLLPLSLLLILPAATQTHAATYDRLAALALNPAPQTESPQAGPK